jgi:hypothetical protein
LEKINYDKKNPIKKHLIDADEKYFEHFSFAFKSGSHLIGVGLALITHSILPCFFTTTASRNVRKINEKFQHRTEETKIRKSKSN